MIGAASLRSLRPANRLEHLVVDPPREPGFAGHLDAGTAAAARRLGPFAHRQVAAAFRA